MTYSIKTRGATLWKTGFTVDQIRTKFSDQEDSDEWLICPLGDAADAIDVNIPQDTHQSYPQKLCAFARENHLDSQISISPLQGYTIMGNVFSQGLAAGLSHYAPLVLKKLIYGHFIEKILAIGGRFRIFCVPPLHG